MSDGMIRLIDASTYNIYWLEDDIWQKHIETETSPMIGVLLNELLIAIPVKWNINYSYIRAMKFVTSQWYSWINGSMVHGCEEKIKYIIMSFEDNLLKQIQIPTYLSYHFSW